jgi:hypothetical protein
MNLPATPKDLPLVSIREVLLRPQNNPSSWFYLPPDPASWTLDTLGLFEDEELWDVPDDEERQPRQAKEDGWIASLDKNIIEEVIAYATGRTALGTAVIRFVCLLLSGGWVS